MNRTDWFAFKDGLETFDIKYTPNISEPPNDYYGDVLTSKTLLKMIKIFDDPEYVSSFKRMHGELESHPKKYNIFKEIIKENEEMEPMKTYEGLSKDQGADFTSYSETANIKKEFEEEFENLMNKQINKFASTRKNKSKIGNSLSEFADEFKIDEFIKQNKFPTRGGWSECHNFLKENKDAKICFREKKSDFILLVRFKTFQKHPELFKYPLEIEDYNFIDEKN